MPSNLADHEPKNEYKYENEYENGSNSPTQWFTTDNREKAWEGIKPVPMIFQRKVVQSSKKEIRREVNAIGKQNKKIEENERNR